MLEFGQNCKAKLALNNKEWHVKTYIDQSAMNENIYHPKPAQQAIFEHQNVMHQKLKFDNQFRIQFTNQEMAFRLCTKQSAGGNSHE